MPQVTALPAATTATDDDILLLVDAPGSTAVAKKITAAALKSYAVGAIRTYNVNDYGAVADVRTGTDGVTTASSTTFTSATIAFTTADTGKTIVIAGAGTAGATHTATITYVSATQVTLSVAAVLTTSGKTFRFGTSATSAIQSAVDAANATRGVVYIPPGSYAITASITHKLNTIIKGAGRESTVLYSIGDGFRILEDPNAGTAANTFQGVEDLTLWGTADLYPVQGLDVNRLSVMRAERIWWKNVHAIYGRQMGLTGIGTYECRAEGCTVEKILRDGLNATGSYSFVCVGNTFTEIADDAIAFHISASYALGTIFNPQAVIVGNRLVKCQGIKCLGATNNIICGNTGRFLPGYGIYLDADTTFNEGYKDQVGVIIANNCFMDIINLNQVGSAQDVSWGIYVAGTGVDGNWGIARPGTGTAANAGQTNDAWDKTGSPSTGTYSVIVANNVVHQMLESTTNTSFSQFGFGSLWFSTGYQDPTFYGTIGRTGSSSHTQGGAGWKGIKIAGGAARDLLVQGNKIYGFTQGIDHEFLATNNNRVHYRHNEIIRCVEGCRYYTTADIYGEFVWEGNYFDLDPIFEAGERTTATSQPTGTWTIASSGSTARAFTTSGSAGAVKGLQIRGGNTFKNVAQITQRHANEEYLFADNYLILDPVSAGSPSYGGVNVSDAELFASSVISTVCDPRLATYDQMRNNSNARAAAVQPAAGVWAKGTFVRNTAMAISSGTLTTGWMRLTSGSGNTANTDWMAITAESLPVIQKALTSNATANSTTTGVAITGLTTATTAGTFTFQYFIRYQSGATTTGVKFGVNHTGTAAVMVANMRYQDAATATVAGAATQADAAVSIVAGDSTRTKTTTAPDLGPTASVDTLNADMLAVVDGIIIVTVAGNLELWHASEVAASSQVMAGSSLVLTQTA